MTTMYSISPRAGESHGSNIGVVSSPLSGMSLSSPLTPLGHSPQPAQRALLQQMSQEIRQLEMVVNTERHLKYEIELDLQDLSSHLEKRELRIHELEHQVKGLQKEIWLIEDKSEESEMLRSANEKLSCDVSRLQSQLAESLATTERYQLLERKYRDALCDLQSAREQLQLFDSLKLSNEELHAKCQQYERLVTNLQATLEKSHLRDKQMQLSLEEACGMREACLSQCKILQQEKEELEELFGVGNVNTLTVNHCVGLPVFGESMAIVAEKKLSDLQAELDNLRSSWINPVQHDIIKERLQLAEAAKERFKELYVDTKRKLQDNKLELTNRQTEFKTISFLYWHIISIVNLVKTILIHCHVSGPFHSTFCHSNTFPIKHAAPIHHITRPSPSLLSSIISQLLNNCFMNNL